MIAGIALLVLNTAASPAQCENLTSMKLSNATITSAVVIPEGPPPARGARGAGADVIKHRVIGEAAVCVQSKAEIRLRKS